MGTTPKAGSTSSGARPRSPSTSGTVAWDGSRRRVTITLGMSAAPGTLDPGQGRDQRPAVDDAPAEVVVEAGAAEGLGGQGPRLGRGQARGRVLLADRGAPAGGDRAGGRGAAVGRVPARAAEVG